MPSLNPALIQEPTSLPQILIQPECEFNGIIRTYGSGGSSH